MAVNDEGRRGLSALFHFGSRGDAQGSELRRLLEVNRALASELEPRRLYAKILDAHLDGRTWLVGRNLTLADFTLAASLMHATAAGVKLDPYPNLKSWNDHIGELDAWQATEPKR